MQCRGSVENFLLVKKIAEIQMSFSSTILGKDNEKDVQNENSILEPGWIKTEQLIYGN